MIEILSRIQLHAFDDSSRLEGICFKSRTSDVLAVGILRNACGRALERREFSWGLNLTYHQSGSTRIPVWSQKAGERSYKVDPSTCRLLGSENVDLRGLGNKVHRVFQPGNRAASTANYGSL